LFVRGTERFFTVTRGLTRASMPDKSKPNGTVVPEHIRNAAWLAEARQ
jgi:hypothetical protein